MAADERQSIRYSSVRVSPLEYDTLTAEYQSAAVAAASLSSGTQALVRLNIALH